jgi:hypothetical protein
MRTLTFDQFEFDDPSSEEPLEVALASRQEYKDVAAFLAATGY